MMGKILILLSMVFCHIVDDYYLQGWLASAKQKEWWNKNAPDELYKYDYIVALFMHSFSWTFMVMLIPTLITGMFYPFFFVVNVLTHMYVDNLKANKKMINLIEDQSMHMIQIFCTWYTYMF